MEGESFCCWCRVLLDETCRSFLFLFFHIVCLFCFLLCFALLCFALLCTTLQYLLIVNRITLNRAKAMQAWHRNSLILLGLLSLCMNLVYNSQVSLQGMAGISMANSMSYPNTDAAAAMLLASSNHPQQQPCPTTTKLQSHNDNNNKNDETKIDIFYNLFVKSVKDIPRVQAMLNEQLSHWNASIHGRVLVSSIAVPLPNLTASSSSSPPIIHLLQHRAKGMEEVTLDALWEYCVAHPTRSVIYLHSKGSFHATWQNERFRRVLTRAALSLRPCKA